MEETKAEEPKKLKKAQLTSLLSKIIGITFLLVMYTLGVMGKVELDVNDLIKVTITTVGLCGTIDLNLMFDKFLKK